MSNLINQIKAPFFISFINGAQVVGVIEHDLAENEIQFNEAQIDAFGTTQEYECFDDYKSSFIIADNAVFTEKENGVFETTDVFGETITFNVERTISNVSLNDILNDENQVQIALQISVDHVEESEFKDVNHLFEVYSDRLKNSGDLPDGASLITVPELIAELNEFDQENYYRLI